MSTFSWVLIVVGLFLVLYAAGVLLGARRGPGSRRRESLGCGFVLLAAVVWGIALGRYLADSWAGLRLGVAFALILPALATLLNPARGRVLASVVLLTFAVIMGASAAPKLWAKVRPPRSQATVQEVEKHIAEMKERITSTEVYADDLADDAQQLVDQLRSLDHGDFDAVAADPEGLALLEELAEAERLQRRTEEALDTLRRSLPRMESALRRIRRLADAQSASGMEEAADEIARILKEAGEAPLPSVPATVEEHFERQQLRELFERRF